MIKKLTTNAELNAEKAENLRAFSGLKLLHIKRQVAAILGQIGQDGIFDEYTKHDISHIDYMLESLDWIIPTETQQKLTPADWLMITLSIYFHDLGMLVTKDEYENRHQSEFPIFKNGVLEGDYGLDYKDKVAHLSDDRVDRFLYQEMVRKNHAERIKDWILDESNSLAASYLPITSEVKKLLGVLDDTFRRDLAIVCESHHLSDLDDLEKYKTNQQYGPSAEQIVNVHYAALILRTADLLHITSDRTPTIEFSLINPTDPISQEEWAKQMAVRTVRAQVKKNKEGAVDRSIQSDTVEILARFNDEKGFFGLIAYLNYAAKQLKESYDHNRVAKTKYGVEYEFPWKNIDDSSIEAKDFEKKQFEFVLDQMKILDLLVGHTLYNDSSVVVRELTQNAIDATKLKLVEYHQEKNLDYLPEISVKWEDKKRELTFTDNGTGMTLEIIQNHLLTVGSSRYQADNFKKKYPDFSSISRFGIGLLTCFLIADDIDITTKSQENDKAILLKIRKVHGKYLLKYLTVDKLSEQIIPHGTEIKLFVRSEVNLTNLEDEMRKWILFPNCDLSLQVDDKVIKIGYSSPKATLEGYLSEIGYDRDKTRIKVIEIKNEGVTLAVALKYIEHWNEWDFLDSTDVDFSAGPIGTCIEGIMVEFNTPGFTDRSLLCIANTTGGKAPKTNVARSNIEMTPEREFLLYTIYNIYLEHISTESQRLIDNFSITWASGEVNWLLRKFIGNNYRSRHEINLEDERAFEKALAEVNCILIEENGARKLVTLNQLKEVKHFWTLDCASYTSANSLIKEVKSSNVSSLVLLNTIIGEDSSIEHIDYLLCNKSDKLFENIVQKHFQVDHLKIIREQRRLDLRWSVKTDVKWEEIEIYTDNRNGGGKFYIQILPVELEGLSGEIAINTDIGRFLLDGSELHEFMINLKNSLGDSSEDMHTLSVIAELIDSYFDVYESMDVKEVEDFIALRAERNERDNERMWDKVDKQALLRIMVKLSFDQFDTMVWHNRRYY